MFELLFPLLILAVWTFGAVNLVWNADKPITKLLSIFGASCMVIGCGSFMVPFLFVSGFDPLTTETEYPVSSSQEALLHPSGFRVAAIEHIGRIQIYDSQSEFIRGWSVDAGGGTFKAELIDEDTFRVVTARGNQLMIYALDGTLLETSQYIGRYIDEKQPMVRLDAAAPWYFWPLTHPFKAWFIAAFGMLSAWVIGLIDGEKKPKPPKFETIG